MAMRFVDIYLWTLSFGSQVLEILNEFVKYKVSIWRLISWVLFWTLINFISFHFIYFFCMVKSNTIQNEHWLMTLLLDCFHLQGSTSITGINLTGQSVDPSSKQRLILSFGEEVSTAFVKMVCRCLQNLTEVQVQWLYRSPTAFDPKAFCQSLRSSCPQLVEFSIHHNQLGSNLVAELIQGMRVHEPLQNITWVVRTSLSVESYFVDDVGLLRIITSLLNK